ncbi:MAG TPA: hypothetical protein VFS09_08245 [Candidatus Eisenbacteria bacterium]|nr:hypothetical protein [Candidatus Eisenbacteria bacterium]
MMRHERIGAAPAALAALAAALLLPAFALGSGVRGPTFESHWQDGRAELSGYRYHVLRYGEPRAGQAVMITVTEPFSESKRVKADDPAKNPADTFEALKMNLVRDFQTGIYDYNTMTSVFVRSRDFSPVKVSFSGSEWCGNVYEEILFDRDAARQSLRSYFEGESGERSLRRPPGGVSEDQLFILVRGLRGDFLRAGERRTVALLPGSFVRRLAHRPLSWVNATIERSAKAERVTVPAGTFQADLYRVRTADSRTGSFWVERPYPHRIVRWSWSAGAAGDRKASEATESAELAGSARLPYWQLHGNGQETYLKQLGLEPLPTPGPGR